MDAKKLVTGTVAGTVAQAIFGYLIFDLLLGSFYAANMTQSADLMREASLLWPMILGNIALALLVTLAVLQTGSGSLLAGFKIGAIVGFLVWFGVHFNMYAMLQLGNLSVIIVDSLAEAVRTGITGAIIALVLARFSAEEPKEEPAPAV
jgi:hypothetical protein